MIRVFRDPFRAISMISAAICSRLRYDLFTVKTGHAREIVGRKELRVF